jgi:hypothetical protein
MMSIPIKLGQCGRETAARQGGVALPGDIAQSLRAMGFSHDSGRFGERRSVPALAN